MNTNSDNSDKYSPQQFIAAAFKDMEFVYREQRLLACDYFATYYPEQYDKLVAVYEADPEAAKWLVDRHLATVELYRKYRLPSMRVLKLKQDIEEIKSAIFKHIEFGDKPPS